MGPMRRLLTLPSEHWLLALMVLVLHASLWGQFGSPLSRSLMLAHLGLVLIWQPLWRRDQRLDRRSAFIFTMFTAAFVTWLSWWLVFVWLLLLIGLIGGRVFIDRRERFAYLITLVALICELLFGCVTRLFTIPMTREWFALFDYGLLVPPVILILIPVRSRSDDERSVDFLHGLTMSLLTSILALGSLLVMYSTNEPYPVAMFHTMLSIAAFLFAISWLLTPHPGFSGLGQLWARYVLNIGSPFEQWLTGLAEVAREHHTPRAFVEAAMAQFVDLPWVAGVQWKAVSDQGSAGSEAPHAAEFQGENLTVKIFTRRAPGTTLMLHGKLLIQVIGYFYAAKRAQQELAGRAHLQAIYETGARVTHDIKNLLQSLYTMSVAVEQSDTRSAAELQKLLQRQLPHLTQRLQLALDKLQSPGESAIAEARLRLWWDALAARHAADDIRFEARIEDDVMVPAEFFDSVAENLLENARFKRQSEPGITIRVELYSLAPQTRLSVCDGGSAVDEYTASTLFKEPVSSRNGLGIGLYQAARQSEQLGYTLNLATNEPGRVCFVLERR